MAINVYKKGCKSPLTKNFNTKEFDCRGVGCCSATKIDNLLVEFLQKIRDHFGKPLVITSGYRCPKHNKKVGGVSNSYHTKGRAADFFINGVRPSDIAKYAESIGVLGIGLYDGFVHIDTRTRKSFWFDHKQERRETFGGGTYALNMRVLCRGCVGEDVESLQILLSSRGYNVGLCDGVFGANTAAAVASFQGDNELLASGVVDFETMVRLIGRK